jgi:hypothetical protein
MHKQEIAQAAETPRQQLTRRIAYAYGMQTACQEALLASTDPLEQWRLEKRIEKNFKQIKIHQEELKSIIAHEEKG